MQRRPPPPQAVQLPLCRLQTRSTRTPQYRQRSCRAPLLLQTITQEARSDADVLAVRSGGMPTRLGRTAAVGGIAPAPSIG